MSTNKNTEGKKLEQGYKQFNFSKWSGKIFESYIVDKMTS